MNVSFVSCKVCGLGPKRKMDAEISLRFPGLANLDVPAVLMFPYVVVCLSCGAAEFSIPESELRRIKKHGG
jgi:hypothetical protein